MHEQGTHTFPAMERVDFGRPAAKALATEAERLGSRRVFLIVSRSMNNKTEEIAKIVDALGERCAGVFDGVAQHTTRENVAEISAAALAAGADLLVAVGGGSVVDAAKITTLCMEHGIVDPDGLDGFQVRFDDKGRVSAPEFRGPSVRMVAIPTTLSGGEYNAGCLVTDPRRDLKQTFFHRRMMPITIILDPALMHHAPDDLYVGSGTRAMDHAIEALCSPRGTPLVDAVVLQGLALMAQWLPRSQADRGDLEAARQCQTASWLCSFGLQARVPMGASHAIGHVLGGTCHVPHYLCTPVMMPAILAYNQPSCADAQQKLAAALGHAGAPAADAFGAFCAALGLPTSLGAVGVGADQFELIGATTMREEFFIYSNPRPVRAAADVVDILRLAA
jgi:alcohol dehydrogenase class IV